MEMTADGDERRKRARTDDLDVSGKVSSPIASQPTLNLDLPDAPVPKRVACVPCRQSKLRCDSPKDPCSRCERLGVPCTKDKGYKRVNKKSKIDDLEKAVLQLQASIANPPAISSLSSWTGPSLSLDSPPITVSSVHTNIGSTGHDFVTENPTPREQEMLLSPPQNTVSLAQVINGTVSSRSPATKARAIDSTALGSNEIDTLFNSYFDHFHPFFPLLNSERSPDVYYEWSPFLFWTIIGVASRRYTIDTSLQPTMAKTVLNLAWKVIADPPLTYGSVQSILIMCMWPVSSTHLWSDASTSFSNIAMVAAMHMGLHRPNHLREFYRIPKTGGNLVLTESDKLERNKTWAACNIVTQYTIVNVGYPPTSSCFDWSIERACELGNPHSVPDDLRFHLIIQKFSYRTTKIMSDNVTDPLGMPSAEQWDVVMKMQEHEIATIEGQLAKKLSVLDRILLRGARLYLETYHWLGHSWTEEKRKGILKSYATSVALINDFITADASFQVLSFSPITYPRMLFNAAYIIMRVLNSSLSSWVDADAGATLFHSSVACMRRYSCLENDITARAAIIIMDVWQHRDELFRNDKVAEPILVSRSRLGGSMTFDCLWRWKEKYPEKRISTGSSKPANYWPESANQGTVTADSYDPINSTFDWALFDDFDWPWTFDGPPVLEA